MINIPNLKTTTFYGLSGCPVIRQMQGTIGFSNISDYKKTE